ncbi:MAG: D-alanyl-D-alanine carboxypeptidase [Clostridia bacterium]|nr:MAG: D-alanyl-D-alanine carboxypeptidase [Clostridia bacterium]
MKESRALFLWIFLLVIVSSPAYAAGRPEPEIQARAAIVMDVGSGRVLYDRNIHMRLSQASTTKITTAILALEKGNRKDRVRVSRHAAETGGSSIWLAEGEVHSLDDLVYALMLDSANDAAVAIAEHVAGSEEAFVAMMNAKAKEIGAGDTHYANPHGLPDPEHYSSAYDLALLSRYALQMPAFREIVQTRERVIPWEGHEWSRLLQNINGFLFGPRSYPGAIGVKTGYTQEAGRCLVAAASRDGWELIAVVLNSPDIYGEAASLLDYAFASFRPVHLVSRGEVAAQVRVRQGYQEYAPVVTGEAVALPLPVGEDIPVEREVKVPPEIEAPVSQGEQVGTLVVSLKGEKVAEVPLAAARAVPRRSFWDWFLIGLKAILGLA